MSSAPRGLAPRKGLGSVLMKMGRAGPPFEPRRRPHAGKSGDPRSQNADSSPRAQGAPGLGRAGRRKGKSEAPWALTACGLGRRVVVDWAWASSLPTTPRQLCGLDKSLHAKWVMITCDRGGRRLASTGYKYGTACALPVHPSLLLLLPDPCSVLLRWLRSAGSRRQRRERLPERNPTHSRRRNSSPPWPGRGGPSGGVEALGRAGTAGVPASIVCPRREPRRS